MAMGRRGRDEAERAIASCRPFGNSTGSFRGTEGNTRNLGYLYNHPQANEIKRLLREAVYVVWSYQTPIGCVTEDETGNITKVYFDVQHSATTSGHQTILRCAFSDFETIGDGPWTESNRPTTGRSRGVRYGEGYRQRSHGLPVGVRDRVVRAYQDPRASGPEFIASSEDGQRATLAQMLDPRYADPGWTPYLDENRASNLPEGAEERDWQRIENEGPWRP